MPGPTERQPVMSADPASDGGRRHQPTISAESVPDVPVATSRMPPRNTTDERYPPGGSPGVQVIPPSSVVANAPGSLGAW